MSGGSHDYMYNQIQSEYVGHMYDVELDYLMQDICELLHDVEWFDSGDYGEDTYRKCVDKFKKKWFNTSRNARLKLYIDESVNKLKQELLNMIGDK